MNLELIKYKAYKSGSLEGFADFRLTDIGLEIYGAIRAFTNRVKTLTSEEYRRWYSNRSQLVLQYLKIEAVRRFKSNQFRPLRLL